MKTCFVLMTKKKNIIGVFDSLKLCCDFWDQRRVEKSAYFLESGYTYKGSQFINKSGEMIYVDLQNNDPHWDMADMWISEQEILDGSIEDFPVYDIKIFNAAG